MGRSHSQTGMEHRYLNTKNVLYSLQVVSTRVGGVPEVLPDDLIRLADPNVPGQRAI